ncbi:MAG: hypothetical protein LBK25_04905 [Treponema sp.]|jgi:chromosome segregation ATPase|nr:hypothetical protein [Treponema sp.]
MNEKIMSTLFIIGLIVMGLWAITASIAAWIFHNGRDEARIELATIREAPANAELQASIDAIQQRNAALEQDNAKLTATLDNANANKSKLAGIIDNATGLAETGRQSIRDARQTISGLTETISELRNNYNHLANLVITSERNYSAIISELNKGSTMGGINGATLTGE